MTEQVFGSYRLVELLGRGGMGEVWRAVDTSQGDREVALKMIANRLDADPDFVRRFRRESESAAGLRSPHMVPIHRYGEVDGRPYIEMELVDGVDLSTLLRRDGPLPAARAVEIVAQIARALHVAHRAGKQHRDVKPSNILVHVDAGADHAYLIDFGIARAVDDSRISRTGDLVGTLAYMAPERFAGDGDHRSDVYALGCVLYEALTGGAPFQVTDPLHLLHAHQSLPIRPPSEVGRNVPRALDEVVALATAKDPAHRYPSALDLARAAGAALAPVEPTVLRPLPPPGGSRPPDRRREAWPSRRVAVGAMGVLLLVVAGLVGWSIRPSGPPEVLEPIVDTTTLPVPTTPVAPTPSYAPSPVTSAGATPTTTIPDSSSTGVSSTIRLSGPGTVSRLSVDVHIRHTYTTDIQIRLTAPSGASALISDRRSDFDDDIDYTFTSAADAQLARLVGERVEGPWTLTVSDVDGGVTGTLDSWSIDAS